MGVSWLLLRKSGTQSLGRLGLTIAAIALGTVILACFIAGVNGLMARAERENWVYLAFPGEFAGAAAKKAQTPVEGVAPLQISTISPIFGLSKWKDKAITVVSMRATGVNSPQFVDMPTPKPGEYYVSPALAHILKTHPEENVGSRYGTRLLGVLPSSRVASPDSLMVVRGASADELADRSGQQTSTSIYTTDTALLQGDRLKLDPITPMMLLFGGTILLFPIVMFIAVSTQLGSAQREQRYAALRLVGATRSQVNRILMYETSLATIAGISLGYGAFLLLRPQLEAVQFAGRRFWLDDMTVGWWQFGILAGITIVLSLFANWRGMRKVQVSPLGVVRRAATTKRPRVWRVLPLAAGLAIFTWLSLPGGQSWLKQQSNDSVLPLLVLMGGILLVMSGLVLAGSWLTARSAQLVARMARRPVVLIASRRIAGHSRQIFRSVSGVVLALFAGSFYLATVSGIDNLELHSLNTNGYTQLSPSTALVWGSALDPKFADVLRKQPYVASLAEAREVKASFQIACSTLAEYTKRQCPADTAHSYAYVDFAKEPAKAITTIPSIDNTAPAAYFIRLTNMDHFDKLRTLVVQHADPKVKDIWAVSGADAQKPHINPLIKDLAAVTYIGIGVTLFVAIASLLVSTAGGLLERRKSLFTLRLGGMTVGQMQRMVMIESLIPLITVSAVAAGVGIWVAYVFLQALSSTVRVDLSPTYFAILGVSLVAAVVGIYAMLPMIRRITSLEQNQTE